jgi:uncharacterized protein (TIGR02246 family)
MPQRLLILSAALSAVILAQPLRAQRDMYGMGGSSASEVRRSFEAETRGQVLTLLSDYESAWGSRDLAALAGLYAANATLYPAAGGMLAGQRSIRDYFRTQLPTLLPLQTRLMEVRASGDMAVATVRVHYQVAGSGPPRSVTGTDVFVLRRSATGSWSVLSQLSRVEPEGGLARDSTPSSDPAAERAP